MNEEMPRHEFLIEKYVNTNGLCSIKITHKPTNLSLSFCTGLYDGQLIEYKLEKSMMNFLSKAVEGEIYE